MKWIVIALAVVVVLCVLDTFGGRLLMSVLAG
jgi:hypothetical protein